jgi:two-component system, OmpR family, sensor kinase
LRRRREVPGGGHGHSHGGPHGHGHGHGHPFPFDVPRRSRLQRRLFLWFGATIVLTGLVVGAVVALFGPGGSHWQDDIGRFRELGRTEFSRTWDRPEDRKALTSAVAHAFRADVTVEDASGRVIEQVGERCEGGYELDVRREGTLLGVVHGCLEPHRHPRGTFFVGLLAAVATLWGASAFIARRLTRPLGELVRVTRAIGDGDLAARVRLGRHQTGEVGALADSVNEMAVRIERQLKEERELMAAVSHELRSPLARLRVLVELARTSPEGASGAPGGAGAPPDNTNARLAEIEREIVGIDALIGKLLASSRLEFGAARPQTLVANEAAARALESAGVAPERLVDETNGAPVEADPTLLARALGNLLENAQEHAGGVERLTIREAPGVLRFEVSDRGPGFSSEELTRVFEPFTRGKKTNGASLGLGLSLVARIARAHGGRAFAENAPGGGAVVVVELPTGSSHRTE